MLNLPDKVCLSTSANTEKAAFVYLADGTSVGMFAHLTGTTYAGNLTLGTLTYTKYPSLVVQGAEFAAGRINASSGGVGTEVWYYTRDHLGSTRLITDANGAVKERSDYYPFGLRMEGGILASGNRWRFAGKEEQKAGITLDWLNFGARMYDPCLGRWTTQDPLAEKYPGISPYAYCANNPLNLVDPDGRDVWEIDESGNIVNRFSDSTRDAFYLVRKDSEGNYNRMFREDEKGERKEVGIEFDYGTISSDHIVSESASTSFSIESEQSGAALFKFFADNLPIEVGFIGSANNKGYILMQNNEKAVRITGLARKLDEKGTSVMTIIHSHPRNSIPSGFNPEDQIPNDKFAASGLTLSHGIKVEYYVYQPKYQGLIQYDSTKILPGRIIWNTLYF